MKFKRLEMVGFKSFVDRTVIEFGDRLTAVVGPNGCGKSNVSDAIRWVLGEQAPRALRAKRMEDVIFNGSADRKPYGMAEVSLTISNIKGVVTSPEYKDFEELIVTRRLYRSGESEYLINRNPARLKDITDLFLDTGVSLDTFSIVEQGRIEGLVNAKPLDRRLLIEEAAGIMKYKSRRNEALRKLELAQGNLLRVADVMREKESRLRSLRRQAKKATFYKEYQQEVEELSLRIAALELLRLEAELSPAEEEYTRLKGQEELLLASISATEADRERLRIELSERSEKLAETRRHAVEVEGVLQRLDNRLE
ncbi:MAG: AAA family ATPase, partial [bacterium]|nr:AAA family ATPase [bacterium]